MFAIWICRYWSLSICPGASGVTARPWVASATVVRATSRGARGVESQVPVANRLGGTDRSTSLRSDGRSTSPEFVFHFTELRTRAGTATGGCGRRRSYGRKERAHRSLENRKERGFPQRPQPIVLLHRIWKSTGPTSADRRRAFAAFSPGRHEHHVHDSTRREIPCDNPTDRRREEPREPRLMIQSRVASLRTGDRFRPEWVIDFTGMRKQSGGPAQRESFPIQK